MLPFASNLRRRAEELGIPNAEVARRVGLSERRYANYVSGKREPDLATLVRIAEVLGTSPNSLLTDQARKEAQSIKALLQDRLRIAASLMDERSLEITVIQAEAIASVENWKSHPD
ncbi:transcriptional regulator with XRE-family HTH domain [Mesorhizobium sp. RMAD-H1]|nr:helix-turn-helix transcriptional regulator [Mesorhizobium sp. RMAD-H1]MBB2974012.1 transcriptional regulator with XRE-family HTH domain [Mesorhizobium sp. RMAD-H1]